MVRRKTRARLAIELGSEDCSPCGRAVEATRHQEDDEEGLVFNDLAWACGCRKIWHQFHDGSVRTRITRHDGRVMLNELSAEHAE